LLTKDQLHKAIQNPNGAYGTSNASTWDQLAQDYPYFSPGLYLHYLHSNKDQSLLQQLQLSSTVNPVLLQEWLQRTDSAEIIEVTDLELETLLAEEAIPIMDDLIVPIASEDYFKQQGIVVPNELPDTEELLQSFHQHQTLEQEEEWEDKSLMVVMSYAEWLKHIKVKNNQAKEELEDQKALKAMWQKQKLAAIMEEENDEIPEQVFEMAVNSVSANDEIVSESLAEVYLKQGKKVKAIEIYKKLSLLNPEKNTYFVGKIENLQKEL
jgi:tetratricopeptide (TPR) repeat protein